MIRYSIHESFETRTNSMSLPTVKDPIQDSALQGVSETAILSALSESSPDVITQIDSAGRILFWSPGAEKMLGYTEEEILGQSLDLLVPEDMLERLHKKIQQQFSGHLNILHEETTRLSKSGKKIPVLLTQVPIRNDHCQIVALLAIMKDLSEQKNLQKRVENLERNTAMTKVAAKVAHEIRTPLGVLFLKSDLLVERLQVAFEGWGKGDLEKHRNRLEKCVGDIQKQINRLEEIATNYLHLSKTRLMERESVDLTRFFSDICKELREQYHEEEIVLECQVDPDVPTISIDSQQFHRVYANLVRNSVEAMRAAQIKKGKVTLLAKRVSDTVVLEIVDNGPGIPNEIKEAVFDPFTTTKSIGTGLGLYLAREIVENHGGVIEIESEGGKGTTIRITLPIKEKES